MNICADFPKIFRFLRFDRNGLVSPLKQMPMQMMPRIETQRIGALKPFHACHQVWLRRFYQQVVVIGHQNVTMNLNPCSYAHFGQCLRQHKPVIIAVKNRLAMIPTAHDMIYGPTIFNPHISWHADYTTYLYRTIQAFFCIYVRTDPFVYLTQTRQCGRIFFK